MSVKAFASGQSIGENPLWLVPAWIIKYVSPYCVGQVTGSPLFVIKIKSFSAAKSAAVLAIFSIVKVVESPKQTAWSVDVKIGFERKALLSVLLALTHPSVSIYSA